MNIEWLVIRKRAIIWLSCTMAVLLCSPTRAEAAIPKVGGRPPALGLEKMLQAPADVDVNWESLRGKVVVVEFWATWCVPCVAAIPHLNEIADYFKDRSVQFIAITDEDEEVVGPFLKKKPIHAWVGIDSDGSMGKAYGVGTIPRTVVVDRDGIIAAITRPTLLTNQLLEDVLEGKVVARTPAEPGPSSVLAEARDLYVQGEYAEALEKYKWFQRHATEQDSSAPPLSLLDALEGWAALGRKYPPALQALMEIRDKNTEALLNGEGKADFFWEVVTIDGALHDTLSIVSLFERMRDVDPELAGRCYWAAEEWLVAQRRYDLCAEYVADPGKRFEEEVKQREEMLKFAEGENETMKEALAQAQDEIFAEHTCRLLEVLVGLNRMEAANEIKRRALLVRDDPEMQTAIQTAMQRPTERKD